MLFNLDAPPAAVSELERNMRINEDVLRYLTVRVEALEDGPSAVMQSAQRAATSATATATGGATAIATCARSGAIAARESRNERLRTDEPDHGERGDRGGAADAAAPAARGGRSSGGANPARSRARTRPRSTTRT